MAITQQVVMDMVKQHLIIHTSVDQYDIRSSYDPNAFMARVQYEIASQIAGSVLKQIGPAIDEAMKNITFEEKDND